MRQYSGIWTLSQVAQAISDQNWPGQPPPNVEYLVVAGGGGAGASDPGGAGAGGLLAGSVGITAGSAITVTVGGGGTGRSGSTIPGSGSNSVFGSITATGGGYGATASTPGGNGGSSGGGGAGSSGARSAGSAVSGQGNAGGTGSSTIGAGGAGGGGAGTRGLDAIGNIGGAGGAGIASDISGTRTTYAGGGGGSATTSGAGGVGGGGAGAAGANGGNGTANTGGGGGGASNYTGGNGGSGIVILSYPDTYSAAANTTGSPTITTSGSGSINTNTDARIIYANNAAFQFGTGNFTIEAFVNIPTIIQWQIIAKCADDNSWNNGWTLNLNYGVPQFFGIVNGTSALATNTWYHIAAVRNSNVVTLYVNGSSIASASSSANIVPTQSLSIGGEVSSISYPLNGYISNLRIIKGVALYTTNFTSPVEPLSTVANTSLLLNAVSGAFLTDTSTNNFTPSSTINSPTWNSLSPFPTGGGFKRRVYIYNTSGSITF